MASVLSLRAPIAISVCLLAASISSCSKGSGSTSAASGDLTLESVSIASGELDFQINRSIRMRFNRAIDFSTVTSNSVNVAVADGETIVDPDDPAGVLDIGGLPAVGSYFLEDERTIVFQPRCPTQYDLSDSGFLRGTRYTLNIPADSANGVALASLTSGQGLAGGFSLTFETSDSSILSQLFLDPNVDPPAAIVRVSGSTDEDATALEIGGDAESPVYFERPAGGGPGTPQGAFLAPLNFYSADDSRVDVRMVLNQPVNPSQTNISNDRIRLEYQLSVVPEVWRNFPCDVVLDENCTAVGAVLRLIPLGPLPQDRAMRVVMEPEFEDLIGQRNEGVLNNFARFDTSVVFEPGTTTPGDGVDEVLETFLVSGESQGSLEDTDVAFEVPTADWRNGRVSALFDFDGTGGPGGEFDVLLQANADVVFGTVSTQFSGGPGGLPTETQVAIDGVLDVRDLTIPEGTDFRVTGPNPALIRATGNVFINGTIRLSGANASPIFALNAPQLPESGAAGAAGGGDGGIGSPLTTQSSPQGGAGRGGINGAANGGGQGGETGYSMITLQNGTYRRGGGGGGGRFGSDVLDGAGCPVETFIGLNAEQGLPGSPMAFGALDDVQPATGGLPGPGPFTDGSTANDFWGTLLVDPASAQPTSVLGELTQAWAGAGGGAGGDASRTGVYPPVSFESTGEDKGAGGGGGGGGLTILALGDIVFGPNGRIEADGGNGAGGENTNFVNRIGAGSGGGSGGHIVLQSASRIDLSALDPTVPAITALGGQGGAGAGNQGGWDPEGPAADDPAADAKPVLPDAACASLVTIGAGGDGGPGIVQLHAPSLADILPPQGDVSSLRSVILPAPIGLDLDELQDDWDGQLLPIFGRLSRARSKWISLGAVQVAPGSSVLETVEFLFDGIDPISGFVDTQDESVTDLPPIVAGVLNAAPTIPYHDASTRTFVFELAQLAGAAEIYRRNPNLMELFALDVEQVGEVTRLEVVSATTDELSGEVRLVVSAEADGLTLAPGASVTVRPRFFAVSTDDVPDSLPDSSTVRFRFQAAPAGPNGGPDVANATPATSDVTMLTSSADNTSFRFFRFVIDFDISADGLPLTVQTPLPSVEFLRVPFRF